MSRYRVHVTLPPHAQVQRTRSWLVLSLLGCRPPTLVRVAPEGGRMLSNIARKSDACAALLVVDTGFHRKGAGTATASCACMTSAHEWPSLENSLSLHVLPLLDCRSPILVRVAPEGGRMRQDSCIRCTCPRTPLLVLETRGWYVGSRRCSDDGDNANLVTLGSA